MDLYDVQGHRVYEEALVPKPGLWVALLAEPVRPVTAWTVIDAQWRADFTDLVLEHIPKSGMRVGHYLLWDGEDRLRRYPLDQGIVVSRYTSPITLDLFWSG